MSLLARYLIRENLKVLVWIFAILILLCFLIDLVERGDDLLEAGVPIGDGLNYLLLRLSQNILYVLPVSALLGSFITLGILGRNHELLAINASGISGHFIARPLLIVAGCLSLLSFFWAENVVPHTTREASRIWQVKVEKKPQRSLLRHNEVWFRTLHTESIILYHIGFLKLSDTALRPPAFQRASASPTVMRDVTVLRLAPDFSVIDRTDAKGMVWHGDHWTFLHGIYWEPAPSGKGRVERFTEKTLRLPDRPEDFQWIARDVEKMGFRDLRRYVLRAEAEGYDVTALRTELHFRVASSFFCLITVLFTIPLALRIARWPGALAIGVALSMAIGIIYYIVMALLIAFGRTGLIPPLWGAWGANILFGACGIWWMMHLKH